MKKSLATRIKVTKNGKIIMRKMAQCHFRAKKNGKQIMNKSKTHVLSETIAKKVFRKQGEF